jgi:hypothetical protein
VGEGTLIANRYVFRSPVPTYRIKETIERREKAGDNNLVVRTYRGGPEPKSWLVPDIKPRPAPAPAFR